MLSSEQASVLLVRNETAVFEVGAEECVVDAVGLGDFSDDGDKERLAPRVRRLLAEKLQSALDIGDKRSYCRWLGLRTALLRGLPGDWRSVQPFKLSTGPPTSCESADEFLRLVGAPSATSRVHGISPLLIASALGDIPVIDALLESRASPLCMEPADAPTFLVQKGQPEALSALFAQRADINARDGALRTVLETAVVHGHLSALQWLLHAGASAAPDANGVTPLCFAAAVGVRGEIVEALVDGGVPLETRVRLVPGTFGWFLFMPLRISYRLGRRDVYSLLGQHLLGATPLLIAAAFGSVGVVRVLLACRADPTARTVSGLTMDRFYSVIDPLRPSLRDLL